MLDRGLQRRLLEYMREHYPLGCFPADSVEADEAALLFNLAYLEEHGLCEAGILYSIGGAVAFKEARISAAGIDFLENDGGLSAMLGVVTVRFDAETLRSLIASRLDDEAIPAEEKTALRRHLNSLSNTALQAAASQLMQEGIHHLPNAIQWLRTLGGL
jgi:hypothetical protein